MTETKTLMTVMAAALQDIKVVDLTRTLAGPFCTMMLGDMGADVVKIEEPEQGDETRAWTPFWNQESTQFLSFNRNKRSLSLNITNPAGRVVFEDLIRVSDVVYSNLRGDVPARLRIRYDDLKVLNPRVVCCSLSGFGMTGPRAKDPAYDYILQGLAG